MNLNETMSPSWYAYHWSRGLFAQASQLLVHTATSNIGITVFAYTFYSSALQKRFFLVKHSHEFSGKSNECNRTKQAKKFLDGLVASSRRQESVSRVQGEDVLLNVGDVREELLTPLIAQTEQGRPEPVTVTIHFSKKINDLGVEKLSGSLKKVFVAREEDVAISWLQRATTVQGKVELRFSILNELEDLYKTASDFDEGCTLQVGKWGILTKQGGWQLNMLKEVEMPVIYHAEYAAGILKVAGNHLKGAEFRVTNGQKSLDLRLQPQSTGQEVFRISKPSHGKLTMDETLEIKISRRVGGRDRVKFVDVCVDYREFPVRLSTQEMNEVLVYATKGRETEDVCLLIHSTAIHVKDTLLNTVFERWIVANLLLIFILFQLGWGLRLAFPYMMALENQMTLVGILILVSIARYLGSKSSRENCLRNTVHGFLRAIWTIYFGAVDLINREPHLSSSTDRKGLSRTSSERRSIIPEPFPSKIVTSTSTRSFVNSIVKQQKGENQIDISEAWEPFCVEKVRRATGETVLRELVKDEDNFDSDNNPFAVIYRKDDKLPWSDEVNVQLASEHLIKILRKHIPYLGNVFCMERPEVPGRDVFVVVNNLTIEDAGIKQDKLIKAQLHLDLLVRFIRKEYKDVSVRLQRLKQERLVTYDMLWAFFYPGQKIVYKCQYTQNLLCATVAERVDYSRGTVKPLRVLLDTYDFMGRIYRSCSFTRDIDRFEGERLFETLQVCPINLTSRPQEVLEAGFVAHGRRFYELAMQQNYRFVNYQGPIFNPQRRSKMDTESPARGTVQENADGRVMIDTERFMSMNPGFRMLGVEPNIRKVPSSSPQPPDQFDGYLSVAVPEHLSDEKLMFAPGVVLGFSFTLKQWGLFKVDGFSEVVYDDTAFSELVMEPEDKSLIYSLVSQYVADPQQQFDGIDPISKKGDGCIILCYGPPGTGKTLTAESVAEYLHRPLWALSLSQFGTAPEELESTLSRVLNIASLWQAILLLDEADIFLEKRTNNMDLGRNAMIGVFLRQLEYYRGIMFLTTNRVSAFDDAVRSRVSMLVCYRQLGVTQLAQVWKSHLSRAGIYDVSILHELSSLEFNGREIRNAIHTAQVWAKSKNEPLQLDHVKYVVKVFTKSIRTLEEAVENSFDA